MSKSNPRKAIAALIPEAIEIPGIDVVVRPLTLAQFAILERLDSPLLKNGKTTTLELLPSLYVLCHEPAESLHGNVMDKAVAWADSLPPNCVELIKDAANRQVKTVVDVVPEVSVKKKGATTAGSSR